MSYFKLYVSFSSREKPLLYKDDKEHTWQFAKWLAEQENVQNTFPYTVCLGSPSYAIYDEHPNKSD